MQPIKDLINKIKWDKRENPDWYSIVYEDRVEKKYKEIKYNEIKKIEGGFMVLDKDGEEVNIPMHRVRFVKKKNKLIWKRCSL